MDKVSLKEFTLDNKKFIFIGGLHRSGTSLIHEIMKSHDLISGFHGTGVPEDEGQHLQSVYPTAKFFGGPGKFGFNTKSHMDELHPLATQESADKLFDEWSRYWDLSSEFLIEKSPPNIVRTRFLQKLFPNTYFIISFRHPIVVAYATQKWAKKMDILDLIEHSIICYEKFKDDLPFLQKSYVFRYENFVADPQNVMNEIYDFIGTHSATLNKDVRNNVNQSYLQQWNEDRINKKFSKFISLFEDRTRMLGYSLNDPEKFPPVDFLKNK
ncbi:MAG: sulfotransferase [Thermosynechococcaceae cyanobacterium]